MIELTPAAAAALDAANKGNKVFPLAPDSKKPFKGSHGHLDATTDQAMIEQWRQQHPDANFGQALSADQLILDADIRHFPPGRNPLQEITNRHPYIWQSRIVRTPSGGYHVYLTKPADLKVKKQQAAYPGIDFLSAGCFVVTPGSKTPAGTYEVIQAVMPLPAPDAFLASLELVAEPRIASAAVTLAMLPQFKIIALNAEPGIEGEHSDDAAFMLGCKGKDMGLSAEIVFEVLRDFWMPRCVGQFDANWLKDKVDHAFAYGKNGAGCATPEARFTPALAPAPVLLPTLPQTSNDKVIDLTARLEEDQKQKFKTVAPRPKKDGSYYPTLNNAIYFLSTDPYYGRLLRYNEFTNQLEFTENPWWRKKRKNLTRNLFEEDWASILSFLSVDKKLDITEAMLRKACLTIATRYHPLLEYLESNVWDGLPRLDTILIDTAGVEDSDLNRAIGKNLILSCVKRAYDPGCKQDYMMVFESLQGTEKSKWVEALGGEWACAGELVHGDKDTQIKIKGKWIIELPEFNASLTKQDFNWLKAIISMATDRYRPLYERDAMDIPRESVFIATLNPSSTKEYLKDEENRRYLPIKTGLFDIDHLKRNRNQYFAEAVHRYKQGEQAWIDDPILLRQLTERQERRRQKDAWEELLKGWLAADVQSKGFSSLEVFNALGLVPGNVNTTHRNRLYSTLRNLHWIYDRALQKWRRIELGDLV